MKKLNLIFLLIIIISFLSYADSKNLLIESSNSLIKLSDDSKTLSIYNNKVNNLEFSLSNNNSLNLSLNKVKDYKFENKLKLKYPGIEYDDNHNNQYIPLTMIQFFIPKKTFVELTVYNLLGNKLKTILSTTKSRGKYNINFDTSSLGSGVYIYELKTTLGTRTKKLVYYR